MYDNIPNEEQKQVVTIIKRWRRSDRLWQFLSIVLIMAIWNMTAKFHSDSTLLYLLFCVLPMIVTPILLSQLLIKRFVRRLTIQQKQLIIQAKHTSMTKWMGFHALLEACEIDAPKEYLRAAAYTDETPKDQLLRPTNPNDPNTQ
mgnify:CR=1 FL=1